MKSSKYFDKYNWILTSILIFLIIWIIIIELFKEKLTSNVDNNWDQVYYEKTESQKELCSKIFYEYQTSLLQYTKAITSSDELKSSVKSLDVKRIYNSFEKLKLSGEFSCEIYDKKFNLIFFTGRELMPELYLLQKCISGKSFSYIKNIGFYTYLLIFTPVLDKSSSGQETIGIVVTASLIDVTFRIKEKFFPAFGLTNEIKDKIGVGSPRIITSESIELSTLQDRGSDKVFWLIKGIDDSVIGAIILDQYDKQTYSAEVRSTASKFISALIFLFTLFFTFLYFRLVKPISSDRVEFLKVILFFVLLFIIRYLWLLFKFPSEVVQSDIFNPQYYATTSFAGLAKSLGELFITCMFLLIWVVYVANVFSTYENIFGKREYKALKYLKEISIQLTAVIFFFLLLFLYSAVFRNIITNTNIKFLDKGSLIPSEELFLINIVLLAISFILIFLNCSIMNIIYFRTKKYLTSHNLKKFLFIILFFIFSIICILISILFDLRSGIIIHLLLILLIFITGYYIIRNAYSKRNLKLFSLKNFYIVILTSIIIMPIILLHTVKSKETDYIESLGKRITNQEEDNAIIILSNDLHNINLNKNIESQILDKTKLPQLAFKLWTESKLSNESYNSAVIIIDTNKKIISDFNINPLQLEIDSILNYAISKFFSKPYIYSPPDYLNDTIEEQFEVESVDNDFYPVMFENVTIFKNPINKYYIGITTIEKSLYKNTPKAQLLGYVLIVLQPDIKNLVSPQQQLFKAQDKDNLLYKLISKPIISEFVNSEIETTTDLEIAEEVKNYIQEFQTYALSSKKRNFWKDIIINNEEYKTYFLYLEPKNIGESNSSNNFDRIITFSIREKEFGNYIFYYLKFILINIVLFIFFYLLSVIIASYKLKNLKLNFRNKLFLIFLLISVIPIILLGFYTRAFIINKYDTITQSQVLSDLNLVSEVLSSEKDYPSNIKLIPDTTGKRYKNALERYFIKTDKNFNVFLNNKLVSTTSDELFKSDLLSKRLDWEAYYNLVILKKDSFFKNRHIGAIKFFEGYKPIFGVGNKISAIVSSVTLFRQNEINEELTESITFIFGSYVIVVILLLMLVTFFTDRLSKPILILKEATEKVARSEPNIQIDIKRSDELGILVDSFNKMIKDLEISKEKQKRAEREAAWRDIARRVAHEIKNPLTPIKLSIQHLSKVFKNSKNKEELQETLEKTKEIIIKEIDKLNKIATDFSDFAKMPSRQYELLNVNEVIEEVLTLYSFEEKITIVKNLKSDIPLIKADRQELNRVFQNIIKNAFQAIVDKGTITINSYNDKDFVFVEIIDTGIGMEKSVLEKLFEPNFSTKSSGMGLGLSITKKSLDDMKATITIESDLNIGTKVTLRFHISKNNG